MGWFTRRNDETQDENEQQDVQEPDIQEDKELLLGDIEIQLDLNEGEEDELEEVHDAESQTKNISFTFRLKLTFVELLKTIYTPVTYISFQLIYCISINGTKHLYVSGDQVCYTWWQVVILCVILPGLVVFPFFRKTAKKV